MKAPQITSILLIVALFTGAGLSQALCAQDDYHTQASDYLCDYGIQRYKDGYIDDAIHELRKCLMVNPNHQEARAILNKLLAKKQKPLKKKAVSLPPAPVVEPALLPCPPCPACPAQLPPPPPPAPKVVKPSTPPQPYFTAPNISCISREIALLGIVTADDPSRHFTYIWDFGDGTMQEGEKVVKTYRAGGTYTITLTVDDNRKTPYSRATIAKTITINEPPVANAGPDVSTCIGSEVVFDGSGSTQGASLAYVWDFGDGATAQGIKATHAYEKSGEYVAKLSVQDNSSSGCRGSVDSRNVRVYTPLLNAGPEKKIKVCFSPDDEYRVGFDFVESGIKDTRGLRFVWDFGDGAAAEGKSVSHVYQKGGIYTAKLRIDDGRGLPCSISERIIKVILNKSPVAKVGPNLACCVNTDTTFDASSSYDPDGNALTYAWDFGDGATAQGAKVTHRYTKPGEYNVLLNVKDDSGMECNIAADSFVAQVGDKPVSVIEVKEESGGGQ